MTEQLKDELNPKYIFSMTNSRLLCDIASGKINPVKLAKEQLANRGLDLVGRWVGFKKAKAMLQADELVETYEQLEIGTEEHMQQYEEGKLEIDELENATFDSPVKLTINEIKEKLVNEVLREYLHGSADVEDCEGVTVKQYAAVIHDALLTLDYITQDD